MKCPVCGGDSVVRKTEFRGARVNRFRTCKSCYTNFTTTETLTGPTGSSKSVKAKMEKPSA